jgi:adenosylcobyric acid synthase
VHFKGYAIHDSITAVRGDLFVGIALPNAVLPPDLAWQNAQGNVLGVYVHGLFEDAAVLHALFGLHAPTLESDFNGKAELYSSTLHQGV